MGCWNGTCLISNLPIYAGDEVVFFILKRKRDVNSVEGGHYHSDDLYQPLLYPVVGEYDDYGCIENVKEDFSLIKEYFENVELTEPEWDKDNDVFRRIERGYYPGYSFAMIHKDIYDALIESAGNRKEWWSKGKSVRDFVSQNLEEAVKRYLKDKQIWEKMGEEIPSYLFSSMHDLICGRDGRDYFVARYLTTQDETLREKLTEADLINVALIACRKFWFPQTGAGSQGDEVELYEVLANKMLEKCKQRRQEIESW